MGESPKFTFIYSCTLKEWCCRICFIYPLIYLYRESFKYYLNKCLNHFRTMIGCILFRLNYYFHLLSKYHCNEMKRGSHLIRNSKKVFSKLWKRKFGLLTDPLHDSYLMKFFLAKSNNIYTLCGVINHPTNICFFSYSSHLHYCSLSLSLSLSLLLILSGNSLTSVIFPLKKSFGGKWNKKMWIFFWFISNEFYNLKT